MSKAEYLENVKKTKVNDERIKRISEIYGEDIEGLIAQVVSYADSEDFFDDERRALSFDEIVTSSKNLGDALLTEKAIPVVDVYDSMYVVYLIKEGKWALYSSTDGSIFKIRESLDELI